MALPTLDLPPVITAAQAYAAYCQEVIDGCRFLLNPGLTPEEQAPLLILIDQYTLLRDTYTRLADRGQDLVDHGHPNLPTLQIPMVLKDKLLAGIGAEQAVLLLLHASPDAVTGEMVFGQAVPKP